MAERAIAWKGGAKLEKVLKSMAGKLGGGGAVQVGFFETERYTPVHPIRGTPRKPLPVAQVAFWNNFGTKFSPARPFFTSAIQGDKGYWGRDLAGLAKATNYDRRLMLGGMGEQIKDRVQKSIRVWSQPPNSPKTVKIKGFNKPLIDDGTMQRSVGYEVKLK